VNPIKQMVDLAHQRGVPVLVDGAQAVPHMRVDVEQLGCDFYCASSHKMFGPTGIGFLYGKSSLLDSMPPYQFGGDMIRSVSFEQTVFNSVPHKFEAGTPNIAGAVGLAAAIDYLDSIDFEAALAWEDELLNHATRALAALPEIRLVGTAREKKGVVSFVVNGVHPHDVGTILDRHGVAIRVGHHCAQPVMEHFGVPATVRASLAFYNNHDDIERLLTGLREVIEVFA
jgi:cysteine desulfurase/selenocysteine lyase